MGTAEAGEFAGGFPLRLGEFFHALFGAFLRLGEFADDLLEVVKI
jgi:hypothetical protein